MDVNLPARLYKFWVVLVLFDLLDPGRHVASAGRLNAYRLTVPDSQNVYAIPQVYALPRIGTPALYDPAAVALFTEVGKRSLGWTHVGFIQHRETPSQISYKTLAILEYECKILLMASRHNLRRLEND